MTTDAFAERMAVVTGGASGIGAAVADQLRASGAVVEVADIAPTDATQHALDVTDATAVAAFARHVQVDYGRCDVLVNCAGAIAIGTATECTDQEWDKVFSVNVRGTWHMCKNLIPLMPHGSTVVNVASGAGLRAIPDMAAYVASKHAVVGLTRAMAVDHAAQGVRVNCVCPGLVETPMARSAQERRPEPARRAVDSYRDYLVKRHASAAEIAESICFLASHASRYTTGATLAVDGGRCMH